MSAAFKFVIYRQKALPHTRSQLHKGMFNPAKAGSSVFQLLDSYANLTEETMRLLKILGKYTHHVYLYEPQESFSRADNIFGATAINNETKNFL